MAKAMNINVLLDRAGDLQECMNERATEHR